ncbi:TPA: hypothetical protein ACYU26_002070 [Enterobacter ludwigii]
MKPLKKALLMKKAQWTFFILAAVTTTACSIASQPETDALSTRPFMGGNGKRVAAMSDFQICEALGYAQAHHETKVYNTLSALLEQRQQAGTLRIAQGDCTAAALNVINEEKAKVKP